MLYINFDVVELYYSDDNISIIFSWGQRDINEGIQSSMNLNKLFLIKLYLAQKKNKMRYILATMLAGPLSQRKLWNMPPPSLNGER